MKKLSALVMFLLVTGIAIADETTVHSEAKQDGSGDTWTVTSVATTTTDSGETAEWKIEQGTTLDKVKETIESNSAEAAEKSKKLAALKNKGVKAGPDGQGDFRTVKFPPDIIVIVGDLPKMPRSGPDTTTLKYRSQSQLRSRLGKDLDKALEKMQK